MAPLVLQLTRAIDRINEAIGRACGWLVLVATLISAGNAVVRKLFNTSSNGLLEIQWYLFGAVFLLAAGYTLRHNAHVRIDVLAQRFSPRTAAWIDLVGFVTFILPFVGFVLYFGFDFAWRSYIESEQSADAGGLVRWPAKALIVLGFALLGLQVLSELAKKWRALSSQTDTPNTQLSVKPETETKNHD